MANTVSALKRVRITERRTEINRFRKTRLRHTLRAVRRLIIAKAQNLYGFVYGVFAHLDGVADGTCKY